MWLPCLTRKLWLLAVTFSLYHLMHNQWRYCIFNPLFCKIFILCSIPCFFFFKYENLHLKLHVTLFTNDWYWICFLFCFLFLCVFTFLWNSNSQSKNTGLIKIWKWKIAKVLLIQKGNLSLNFDYYSKVFVRTDIFTKREKKKLLRTNKE